MGLQRTLFLFSSILGLILSLVAASSSNSIENQTTYYSPPTHDLHSSHGHSHGRGTPFHGEKCSANPPAPHGGGGHYSPPSTPVHIPPPTPITTSPPSSPHIPLPTPTITPVTPVTAPPPVPTDPRTGSGPFPCTYWGSHPGVIWRLLGWWGTVGGVFGVPTLPGNADPTSFTLRHALTNKRLDGYSSLYREGAASFLNSLAAPKHFPFTTADVRASFVAALHSDKAAASQAPLFRLANEGRLKLH